LIRGWFSNIPWKDKESDIMKGKGWLWIIGGSIGLILLAVIGLVIFSNLLDNEDGGSVRAEQTAASESQEMAGADHTLGQEASQPGNSPGQNPGQQGSQGGHPPAQATQQPQNPNGSPPTQNAGQGSCTNGFEMDGYSNIALGEQFDAGETFQVEWPIKNTGNCTWDSTYALVFANGDQMAASSSTPLSSSVDPGDSIVLSLQMTAPSQPAIYLSLWKLEDGNGQLFGMDNPPNAPLRVKIEVVQSANNPSNPAVTAVPEISLNLPNTLSNGVGETMLTNQCFDLVEGQEVSCSDPEGDIKYSYSTVMGGTFRSVNGTLNSDSYENAPSESDCESEAYYGMPVFLNEGNKYFCIETEVDGDTVYGWVKPTSFDSGGMTLNYLLWEPDTTLQVGEAMPLTDLFTVSSGEQETLLIDKCFDFIDGNKSACNGSNADIKYIKSGSDYMIESLNDTELAFAIYYDSDAPSKTDCEAYSTYLDGYHYLNQQPDYYACFRTDYGSDTVYGWFRVTSFNSGGMTFDYQVWKP
jgi:hypothetical protein